MDIENRIQGTHSRWTTDASCARVYSDRRAARLAADRLAIVAEKVQLRPCGVFEHRVSGLVLGVGEVWHA